MPEKKRVVGRHDAAEEKHSAAREFTDRENFLTAFDEALGALAPDRHAVLVYHGIGGIGKSRLIRRLRGESPDPPQLPENVVHAKVNFQEARNRLPNTALESARAQLHRQGVRFPTFDIAFAVWWKLAHPNLPLPKSELQFLDEGEIAGDVVAMLADVPVLGLVAKIPRFVGKASHAVQEWWAKRGRAELAHIAGLDEPGDVAEWLPAFFGYDLKAWLAENTDRRAALFFDTHEALWEGRGSGESGAPPDDWLREWAAHLEGVLVVIGGRNKLCWTKPDPTWDGLIEQHLVGELSPEDAERFLEKAGVAEPDVRAAIAEKSRGVPQYLDLAVSTYEEIQKAEDRSPRPDEFDENLEALLECFLEYVKDQRRQALFVLSVSETFGYARFKDLMRAFGGGVMATRKGLQSITQFSFVDEPEPGRYALHTLVREALAAMDDSEDRTAVHRHLFEQAKAALEDVDRRTITDAQRQALREGATHGQAVLEPEAFLDWYWAAERPFDDAAEWRLLLPLCHAMHQYAKDHLGAEHPSTLTSVNNLALLLQARGEYKAAEPLLRRALEGRERVLGAEHPDTLSSVNNLAALLQARGDYEEAEPLFRRALEGAERRLGPEHPHTKVFRGNLARLLEEREG